MIDQNKHILESIRDSSEEVIGIRSMLDYNKFFIFRKDGLEVTIFIFNNKIKKSNHPLRDEEIKFIKQQLKQ